MNIQNTIITKFKKIVCSGLLCAGVTFEPSGTMIHKNNLDSNIRTTANSYLRTQGFNANQIPERLRPDFNQKLDTVKRELLNTLNYQRSNFIELSEIETTVRQTLRTFVDNLRTVVKNHRIDSTVTESIRRYFSDYNLNTYSLPSHAATEFASRSRNIISKLQTLMTTDRRDYVRQHEIEKAVHDEMAVFARRLSNQTPVNNFNNAFDWFDFFFNSPAPAPTPAPVFHAPTPAAINQNKIMRDDLDEKATEIAYLVLNAHGIGDYSIPERVTSEFSQRIQNVIRILKNKMSASGNNYVWKDDIETLMLTELQPLIAKITFKGAQCSICLEDYKTSDRVGILSCGHNYHKDCVYKWFEYQKSCPECKQTGVIVAKIETVL